ncbi:PAAR domain-containing protein [Pseudomonas azerbaijanorientalis]|uniref:PAAR domain-containing protein n=1 Tax=Pseudomonas azerbaijanorientalis TaxID=2842350 RepID=UPI001C3D6F88|nr:PAAR domain-containing protein [Pseudomonas azerbaijanorientalis]QXH61767.1 PAAR domain-containing protein [Pseudomonas azerbaijanorientalis]
MKRYYITVGAKTTVGGTVVSGLPHGRINGQSMAREGDEVKCPECDSTGTIICVAPRLSEEWDGRKPALDGDLCKCKCDPPPKLIANQTFRSQRIETGNVAPPVRAAAQPATPADVRQPTAEPRPSSFTPPPSRPLTSYSEQSGQVCQNLWRSYQQRAEAIVAPGGILISDPKARNRAINSAYARLWLEDQRFQWAGLAAFASKQVGCGLLHAADSIDKIQGEHEAQLRWRDAIRRGFSGLFDKRSEHERQQSAQRSEKARQEYEQARRNNPLPGGKRNEVESLSYVQKQLQYVHDMLALGNTTLFLDVFPLHAFYKERGLSALRTCLGARQDIYEHDQYPVLWPIEQKKVIFGYNHKEILQAFEAVDAGNITESVVFLAEHEQKNILQPAMYSDLNLVALLLGNQFSYVTNLPSGAAAAVELTLASQCRPSDDGRTVGFSSDYFANLADIHQRMPFVLKAATQFDELLRRSDRHLIEQAILDIAAGRGVR